MGLFMTRNPAKRVTVYFFMPKRVIEIDPIAYAESVNVALELRNIDVEKTIV